jgi:(4S)-4-hydroxy-5-phosphonooxypentane-2,3-dione isomerase
MYVLLAQVDVKPEHTEAFLSAMIQVTRTTRESEPGASIRFDVLQEPARPDRFVVYEVWRDTAAFDAHMQAPYYVHFGALTKDWLAGPPTILFAGANVFPPDGEPAWA